jgi:hypothetical protein
MLKNITNFSHFRAIEWNSKETLYINIQDTVMFSKNFPLILAYILKLSCYSGATSIHFDIDKQLFFESIPSRKKAVKHFIWVTIYSVICFVRTIQTKSYSQSPHTFQMCCIITLFSLLILVDCLVNLGFICDVPICSALTLAYRYQLYFQSKKMNVYS